MYTVTLRMDVGGFAGSDSVAVSTTGTGLAEVDESIADEVTDGVVACACDVSQLVFAWICADQDLTLKTYTSGAVLQDTIALKANTPLIFKLLPPIGTVPFAGDVASMKVTNASGSTASLRIKLLTDATPA